MTTLQNLDINVYKQIAERMKAERDEAAKRKPEARRELKPQIEPIIEPMIVPKINLQDYIQVGINGLTGTPVCISRHELPNSNNKNYEDSHRFLLEQGLYMPTPAIFMTHFQNIIDAKNCKKGLFYADNTAVPFSLVMDLYKNLSKNRNNIFGNKNCGAWTWLNARFVFGTGCLNLGLETVKSLTKSGGNFRTQTLPLEECMDRNTFVDLHFTSQGLAKYSYLTNKYDHGKNIYFHSPIEDHACSFLAELDRSHLNCASGVTQHFEHLGSFGCIEPNLYRGRI